MPIRKHRSIEEANMVPRWLPTGDPAIARQMRYLWRLSEFLLWPVGTCIPQGVRKYRSVEQANADREQLETERVRRLRAARKST